MTCTVFTSLIECNIEEVAQPSGKGIGLKFLKSQVQVPP